MTTCLATNPTDPDPSFPYSCTLDADHKGAHASIDSTGRCNSAWISDPRAAVVSRSLTDHGTAEVRASWHPLGEYRVCKCGESWSGEGAILRGHEHGVVALLAGLDAAMAVAS